MKQYEHLYIGGTWTVPASENVITVTSPASELVIGATPEAAEADIDRAVARAREAVDSTEGWAAWDARERAAVLERFAAELEKRAGETAAAVSSQNGMPLATAQGFEGVFPAVLLRYYAAMVAKRGNEERREALLGGTTVVRRDPVGVVAAVVPWNFPQTLAFLKIAPALAAGCSVVVKPAPETVLDAFVMAEAAVAAGLPDGVLSVVPGGRELGAYLVAHSGVDKVAFTGSTAAGRSIAEVCGRLLRPVTLELGGKSAAIVLDDADLSSHLEAFLGTTLLNNGQTCFLSTRILAPRSRYSEVVDTITDAVGGMVIGDPLELTTQVGPLVSARQRERVEGYIAQGRAAGGRVTTGGGRPDGFDRGFYVAPTVFADVDNAAAIAREEIFGPVLCVIPYSDDAEAVRLANDSDYGLGGSVWSADLDRAMSVARRVQTGTIGINSYVNDPVSPFGGVKGSGLGRELGPEGLAGYEMLKSIYNASPAS